jgi:hypothetical protein
MVVGVNTTGFLPLQRREREPPLSRDEGKVEAQTEN